MFLEKRIRPSKRINAVNKTISKDLPVGGEDREKLVCFSVTEFKNSCLCLWKEERDTLLSLFQLSLYNLCVVSITLFSIELLTSWSSSLEEEQRGCLEVLLQQQ